MRAGAASFKFLFGVVILTILVGSCSLPSFSLTRNQTPAPDETGEFQDIQPLMLTRTALVKSALETARMESATLTATAAQPGPGDEEVSPTPTASPAPTDSPTPTVQVVEPSQPSPEAGPKLLPDKYVLKKDEFPWCIARRFDINPMQLLRYNGLFIGQIFYAGTVLKIPPDPKPFPGKRYLHPHTDAYTVRPGDSIYKIACFYGDLDPIEIAQANNLAKPYKVNPGQLLSLPPAHDPRVASQSPDQTEITTAPEETPEPVEPVAESMATPTPTATPIPPTAEPTMTPTEPEEFSQEPLATEEFLIMLPVLLQASGDDRRCEAGSEYLRIDFDPQIVSGPLAPVDLSVQNTVSFAATDLIQNPCGEMVGPAIIGDGQYELGSTVRAIACNWPEDDPLTAEVRFPNNQTVQGSFDGRVFSFGSAFSDPTGLYEFLFTPQAGESSSLTFNLVEPAGPRVMPLFCNVAKKRSNSIFLYNFSPGESVTINVYKSHFDEGTQLWTDQPIGSTVVFVDANGGLHVQVVSDSIEDFRLVFIGEISGPALVAGK